MACHAGDMVCFRSEQERLKHRARQAEDHVIGLRRQLDDRSREVEQLTTLSLKGDATLQEYMAQLTVSILTMYFPSQCTITIPVSGEQLSWTALIWKSL